MGVADDGHHRDRRDIFLVAIAGRWRIQRLHIAAQFVELRAGILTGLGGERCGAEFATAGGIAEQLEPSAVWRERGKIGMARSAGLTGLARETRQSLGRRRKADRQQAAENDSHCKRSDNSATRNRSRKMPAPAPHRAVSYTHLR